MEVGDVARGILRVASAHMVDAIHEITVERGLDPRDGALMAYGGAGGLFATLLASESEIATVIIPPHAGNFSALGLLGADITRTAARTAIMPLADGSAPAVERALASLLAELGARTLADEESAIAEAALDLRYRGQEYALTIALPHADGRLGADAAETAAAFEAEYARIFGHGMDEAIEIVAVRATLRTPMAHQLAAIGSPGAANGARNGAAAEAFSFAAGGPLSFAVIDRAGLAPGARVAGPALITEPTATTYLDRGFSAELDPTGCLLVGSEPGGGGDG